MSSKEYLIPCVDKVADFDMVVNDSHPVWEYLHLAWVEAWCMHQTDDIFKIGDHYRRFSDWMHNAACLLLGSGFVEDGEYIA